MGRRHLLIVDDEIMKQERSETKTVVGFFDILGYEKLVQRMIDENGFVKYLDDLMYRIAVNPVEYLSSSKFSPLADDPSDEAYLKRLFRTIKSRCIYDNVIFSLPLYELPLSSSKFNDKTSVSHYIETLFYLMAVFATLFISKVSHLLRGGLSIGAHYESERDNYLFIFSEAHNRAVRLEKDNSKLPRMLLDDCLLAYLKEISYPNIDKFFYKDDDGRYCFNIYSSLSVFNDQKIIQTLTEIRTAANYHIERDADDEDVLSKWIYFAKYHNKKISSGRLNYPNLVINIDEFIKM